MRVRIRAKIRAKVRASGRKFFGYGIVAKANDVSWG